MRKKPAFPKKICSHEDGRLPVLAGGPEGSEMNNAADDSFCQYECALAALLIDGVDADDQ